MEFIKSIALSIWTNHRKKFITFLFGLLFAGIAAVSDIPIAEIKDAALSAASTPASVTMPIAAPVVGVQTTSPAK